MSFNLDFPILQSWRGTFANWQQKLKLLASEASIGASLFTPQLDWTPDIIGGITTAVITANRTAGWYVQIPGTPLVAFQATLSFSVTAAGGSDNTLLLTLPRRVDFTFPDLAVDFNQVFAVRFSEAGVLVPVVALSVPNTSPLGDAVAVQKTPLAAFGNGSHAVRYGGIYRSINQL